MAMTVKLSDEVLEEAKRYASVFSRSVPKQIEHWARVGRIAEENPELNYHMIMDILLAIDEEEAEPYTFEE